MIRVKFEEEIPFRNWIFPEGSQWHMVTEFKVFDDDKLLKQYVVAMDKKGNVTLEHKDQQEHYIKLWQEHRGNSSSASPDSGTSGSSTLAQ